MTLDELRTACEKCEKCALSATRTNVVFGGGKEDSPVMFVGEGPGEQEDLTGQPFVGRAGKLLDDMLSVINLDRSEIYIANIVKCRPPGNRDPLNAEQDVCIGWLEAQIKIVAPKIIVCLGRIAAMRMIGPDFKITRDHGKWYEKNGVFITALFHPAALLRDPRRKPDTFADLKEIQRKIREVCPE